MFRRLKRGGWPYSQPPNVDFEVNFDSEQSEGLALWMPWGGGTPGSHHHIDRIKGLSFTEGGTPVWMNDRRGWSMLFDDAANEFLQGSTPVVDYPFTFACWGYTDDAVNNQAVMSIGDASQSQPYIRLTFRGAAAGDPVAFVHWNGAAAAIAVTSSGYSVNTWHHLAGVAGSATSRAALIDGGSKGTNADNSALANIDQFCIGVTADFTPIYYMSGRIMDVRIYDRALTDDQVFRVYANPWELWRPKTRRVWAMVTAVPRIPRPPAAYNTLMIY